jgi:hypothetical protein
MVLPITKTTAGVYTYCCIVTDPNGNTAISNTVTLTVLGLAQRNPKKLENIKFHLF